MKLYGIPDVRLFWSEDKGFLNQFKVEDCHTPITYKVMCAFSQSTLYQKQSHLPHTEILIRRLKWNGWRDQGFSFALKVC